MNLLFTTLLSCILDSCHTGPFLFFFIAAVPCHDVGASYFIPPCHWFPSPPNSALVSQNSLDLTDGWRKTCLFLFMFLHDSRCSWTSLCVCLISLVGMVSFKLDLSAIWLFTYYLHTQNRNLTRVLHWPKSSYRFFCSWYKNLNGLFG